MHVKLSSCIVCMDAFTGLIARNGCAVPAADRRECIANAYLVGQSIV